MPENNKIRITLGDVNDPKVCAEVQHKRQMAVPQPVASGKKYPSPQHALLAPSISTVAAKQSSVLYSSAFYTCVAGGVAAFVSWLLVEPFWNDSDPGKSSIIVLIWFPLIGALVGLAIGAIEGVMSRSGNKAVVGGAIGLGIGAAGGLIAIFAAGLVYHILGGGTADHLTLQQLLARSLAWGVAGMLMGLGQGVAMRSGKKLRNGFLGGLAGGFIGGFLFDPVSIAFGGAGMSRAIGITLIGAMVGLMTAIAEQLTKDAWLKVVAGHLAGKEFVIYKNPTVLGSSPKCDIYLFKDGSVEPQHAAISVDGGAYIIQNFSASAGTMVNGRRISRERLRSGDMIQIGITTLAYSERPSSRRT